MDRQVNHQPQGCRAVILHERYPGRFPTPCPTVHRAPIYHPCDPKRGSQYIDLIDKASQCHRSLASKDRQLCPGASAASRKSKANKTYYSTWWYGQSVAHVPPCAPDSTGHGSLQSPISLACEYVLQIRYSTYHARYISMYFSDRRDSLLNT